MNYFELRYRRLRDVTFILLCFHGFLLAQFAGTANEYNPRCGFPIVAPAGESGHQICFTGFTGSMFGNASFSCAGVGFGARPVTEDYCYELPECCPGSNGITIEWHVKPYDLDSYTENCITYVTLVNCDSSCEGDDSDGDGVCDEDDCNPYDPLKNFGYGDPCDDGNPLTFADAYNANCECVGNTGDVMPCVGQDSDGDGICDEDDCAPNDPSKSYSPGNACDDGNPLTFADAYNANCECVGNTGDNIPCVGDDSDRDGVCDEEDCWPDNPNKSYSPGDACDDGDPETHNDVYNDLCTCEGTKTDDPCADKDKDGICDEDDCFPINPNRAFQVGDSCDDGNPLTEGDHFNSNCECIGIPTYIQNCNDGKQSISYVKTTTSRIKVSGDIDVTNLNLQDKLEFRESSKEDKHLEYFDQDNNYTSDILARSESGVYDDHYNPPTLTRINNTGVTSFITQPNEFLNGGWVGDYVQSSVLGNYGELSSGLKFVQREYDSTVSQELYALKDSLYEAEGIMVQYTFSVPTSTFLATLQAAGYNVSQVNGVITILSDEFVSVWDSNKKTRIEQLLENGVPVNSSTYLYEYSTEFSDYILVNSKEVFHLTLSTGDCIDRVIETTFTEFVDLCAALENRSVAAEEFADAVKLKDLQAYPNPVSNAINIVIPDESQESVISLVNVEGQVLTQRTLSARGEYTLDMSHFPAGLYLMKLVQDDIIYSTKIIKQ